MRLKISGCITRVCLFFWCVIAFTSGYINISKSLFVKLCERECVRLFRARVCVCMLIAVCACLQGHPVHVKYDAQMHHGQNRGKEKT